MTRVTSLNIWKWSFGKRGILLEYKNCKRCGKLFHFQLHNVCQSCLSKDQEDFDKIWTYMHPSKSFCARIEPEYRSKTGGH